MPRSCAKRHTLSLDAAVTAAFTVWLLINCGCAPVRPAATTSPHVSTSESSHQHRAGARARVRARVSTLPTSWTKQQLPVRSSKRLWILSPTHVEERDADKALTKEVRRRCFSGIVLTGNARNDLEALGLRCGLARGMMPYSGQVRGNQGKKSKADAYIMTWNAGECYRIVAAADAAITDLDAALANGEGNILAKDQYSDAAPVLPRDEAYCPKTTGLYMLVMSVREGEGDYWFQVWQSKNRKPSFAATHLADHASDPSRKSTSPEPHSKASGDHPPRMTQKHSR